MKISKSLYGIFSLCLIGGIILTSCGREEMGVGNVNYEEENKGDMPDWNKNKTIEFYFLSTLANKTIANNESDYGPINNFFIQKGNACSIGIIDRADVTLKESGMFNGSSTSSFKLVKFPCFAFNKYNGNKMEGSTILFNHRIISQSSYKVANDCYFKYLKILAKTSTSEPIGIEVPFSTVRFDKKEQVTNSETALKELSSITMQAVIIGTIPTELTADLKTVADKLSGYKLTEVTKSESTGYAIFMLAPKSWVLRETTADVVNKDINAYCLRVEPGVEY